MREVQRQLDHDLTLREFLIVKGQRRILRDLEEKERKKKEFEIQNLENQLRLYEDTLKQIQVHIKQRINAFVMIVFFIEILPRGRRSTHRFPVRQTGRGELCAVQLR